MLRTLLRIVRTPITRSLMKLHNIPRFLFTPIDDDNFDPVYVSQYNTRGPLDVENYIKQRGLEYKHNGEYIQLKYCPFCPRHHNFDHTNLFKLSLSIRTYNFQTIHSGHYTCFRGSCGAKGSWYDFKNKLNGKLSPASESLQQQQLFQRKLNKFHESDYHTMLENLQNQLQPGYEYVTGTDYKKGQRGISRETLLVYNIGLGIERYEDNIEIQSVYFPMYRRLKSDEIDAQRRSFLKTITNEQPKQFVANPYELVKCKLRGASQKQKEFQKIIPTSAMDGIFGLNTLKDDITDLVITEGEFDAMAVYEATRLPAISIPFGVNFMPDYLVKWIDEYKNLKTIYLWLDEDEAGRLNAPKMAKKLGVIRTRIVRPSTLHPNGDFPKDANDALRYYPQMMKTYIDRSTSEISKNIASFIDFDDAIYRRFLNADEGQGIKYLTLPIMNKTMKGLRPGELTVVTGPTGCGKTTLLSQMSLDLCKQGVSTLWGSFEIKNDRFLQTALQQFARQNLTKIAISHQDQYQRITKLFKELPLYMMNFYGSTNVQMVIDTIEYAIHSYGIHHICLDNLQFMLGNQEQGPRRFEFQDEVIEMLRRIASDQNVHITIVIHPKKVQESEDLNITSVFGSAKATQEADNVVIIQNRESYRYLDIKKNRYDGDVGRQALGFDRHCKLYFELNNFLVAALDDKRLSISEIITERKKRGQHYEPITITNNMGDGGNNNDNGNGNGNGNEGGVGGNNNEGGEKNNHNDNDNKNNDNENEIIPPVQNKEDIKVPPTSKDKKKTEEASRQKKYQILDDLIAKRKEEESKKKLPPFKQQKKREEVTFVIKMEPGPEGDVQDTDCDHVFAHDIRAGIKLIKEPRISYYSDNLRRRIPLGLFK